MGSLSDAGDEEQDGDDHNLLAAEPVTEATTEEGADRGPEQRDGHHEALHAGVGDLNS